MNDFEIVAQRVEDVLRRIAAERYPAFRYRRFESSSQLSFIVDIRGFAGLEVVIDSRNPGEPGFRVLDDTASIEGEHWRGIGDELKKNIDRDLQAVSDAAGSNPLGQVETDWRLDLYIDRLLDLYPEAQASHYLAQVVTESTEPDAPQIVEAEKPAADTKSDRKPNSTRAKRDSAHFAHPHEKRRAIVDEYRKATLAGEVSNKEAWAQTNFQITAKTLRRYEREFDNQPDT